MGTERVVKRVNGFGEFADADVLSGSGPVVLLHLPLDQTRNEHFGSVGDFEKYWTSSMEGLNVLPESRIIFSAHRYTFSDHVHGDITREISVPAMSWNARDDPGFVIASFQKAGRAVSISHCSLARESQIVLVYISVMFLFCLLCLKG
ncbi:hypothetical protein V8G54_004483 [Vigna mungo]|uniref:Uncharacterized protein n=1 Tax=Vigna mungo TaxID=3915 RepID=A0AAQ3SFV4_VIGMU